MKSTIIGIQGGKGSFSEQAAKVFAKKYGVKDYEITYLISSYNIDLVASIPNIFNISCISFDRVFVLSIYLFCNNFIIVYYLSWQYNCQN